MASKISIAEVRRRLPVGAKFTASFVGPMTMVVQGNLGATTLPPANDRTTERVVKRQSSSTMVSEFLTGPKIGKSIYCDWAGMAAREEGDGSIVLSHERDGEQKDFLSISNIQV